MIRKSHLFSIALLALVTILPACTHQKTVQVGSHKVTVARHGFEKRLKVSDQASVPTFEYAGMSTDGRGLKVSIKGDKIWVNDFSGELRSGDSVLISDDGVAVNSMDYGESEKYLRANSAGSNTTAQN
ncbi:MAG: hypothetical protein ACRD9S_23040 [Pyrinomonadaceae bacterium]